MAADVADSDIPAGNLKAFGATLLALMTIAAFIGNLFLAATILSSSNLRRSIFNLLILNLVFINLLEGFVNMFISLLYVSIGNWRLGEMLCSINAFLIVLLGLEALLGIVLLSCERAVALLSVSAYKRRMTGCRTLVAVLGVWSVGLCFSVPIMTPSIHVEAHKARYFCAIQSSSPLGYAISLVLVHFVALMVLLASFALILHRAHQERVGGNRSMVNGRLGDYTDMIVDHRLFLEQLHLGKFAVILFLVFFILQGPYLFLSSIVQIRNSSEVLNYGTKEPLVIPNDAETAFTWLRFVYPVVLPFFVFGFCKDIWRKFQALICCRKTNMVSSFGNGRDVVPAAGRDLNSDYPTDDNVMTLVATTAGLHLRQGTVDAEGKHKEDYAFADVMQTRDRGKRHPPIREGTSDYDSEESGSWSEAHPEMFSDKKRRPLKTEIVGDIQKTQLEAVVGRNEEKTDPLSQSLPASGKGRMSADTVTSQSQVNLETEEDFDGRRSQSEPRLAGRRRTSTVTAEVHRQMTTEEEEPKRKKSEDDWPDFQKKKDWDVARRTEISKEDLKNVDGAKQPVQRNPIKPQRKISPEEDPFQAKSRPTKPKRHGRSTSSSDEGAQIASKKPPPGPLKTEPAGEKKPPLPLESILEKARQVEDQGAVVEERESPLPPRRGSREKTFTRLPKIEVEVRERSRSAPNKPAEKTAVKLPNLAQRIPSNNSIPYKELASHQKNGKRRKR